MKRVSAWVDSKTCRKYKDLYSLPEFVKEKYPYTEECIDGYMELMTAYKQMYKISRKNVAERNEFLEKVLQK